MENNMFSKAMIAGLLADLLLRCRDLCSTGVRGSFLTIKRKRVRMGERRKDSTHRGSANLARRSLPFDVH